MSKDNLQAFENTRPAAPPANYRAGVAVFFFVSGFNFATFASRIPDLQKSLHLNESELGGLLFVIPVGLFTSLLLTAYLIARFHSRAVMLLGAIVFVLSITLLGTVTQVWQAAVLFFIFGVSRSFFNVAVNTQAVDVQALYTRSIITTFHGVWSLAAFCGALASGVLISHQVSTFHHFLAAGTFNILLMLVAYRYTLPNDKPATEVRPSFTWPAKPLFQLGVIAFGSMICEGTMSEWSGVYFTEVVNAPRGYVTAGYTAYLTTMTIGRFAGDRLVQKTGKKRLLQISGLLVAGGVLLAVALPFTFSAAIGFALTGLGVCCIVPIIFAATPKASSLPSGTAIASVSTVGYTGFLLGPPVIGFVAHYLNLQWSFSLLIVIGVGITLLVSRLKIE